MEPELIKLLTMASYFAFQFECMAPLYCVMCQPYRSEETANSAHSIMQDVERAAQFRIEVEEYLRSKQIEI